MSTSLERFITENAALRAQLEKAKPGITASVETTRANGTLDEQIAEQDALKKIAEAFIASAKVQQRGAAVVAKYQGKVTSHTEAVAALHNGTLTAKQINAQHEISRLEALLHNCKQGSTTWKALSGRIEHERTKLAERE